MSGGSPSAARAAVQGLCPAASALALELDIPWDRANTKMKLSLQLMDQDGQPVAQDGPFGPQPVQVLAEIEAGRPPGVTPGTPLDAPTAINLPPLQLPPGQRSTWVLKLDDETREDWQLALTIRPVLSQPDGGQMPPSEPPQQH